MGIFDWHARRTIRPGAGVHTPPPEKGFAGYIYIIKTHFWKIVTANLIFLLFSIPIVTIPAALTALTKVMYTLFNKNTCEVFKDFLAEFKSIFLKSLILAAISAVVYGLLFFAVYSYLRMDAALGPVGIVLIIIIAVWLWVVQAYVYLQFAVLDLGIVAIIKNALIFSLGRPKNNLLLIAAPGIVLFAMFFFVPYTLPVIVFIGISISQLTVCAVLDEPLSLVIKPTE